MKKSSVFFGEQGLTETSANHVANLAKETLKKDEERFDNICFINKQVSVLGGETRDDLIAGFDESECREIPQRLVHVMKVKSLIAWLREAIKEKRKMHDDVESKEYDEFVKNWKEDHPEEEIEEPFTKETYIETLPIAERCKIFSLQTEAAVIGKVIHAKGALSKARTDLYNARYTRAEMLNNSEGTCIYHYTPSISEEVVDEVFYSLQKKHRSIQAELNSYLNKIEEAVRQSEIEHAHKTADQTERKLRNHEIMTLKWREISKKRHREISALKIVIPNQLSSIYYEVLGIG